jgi:hypothetical protein
MVRGSIRVVTDMTRGWVVFGT